MNGQAKRLFQEQQKWQESPLPNVSLNPVSENLLVWRAEFIGPKDTPFEDGVFQLQIHIPKEYPFKPPKVAFLTRVYHPNVYTNGDICLDILTADKWSPVYSLSAVVQSIQSLLNDPNPNSSANGEAGHLFLHDRQKYESKVRDAVKRHAKPSL